MLKASDVEWVVNDIAELGVKIVDQFFFLYKGYSLVYGDDEKSRAAGVPLNEDTDPPTVHKWRPVFKREFGECAHPINYQDYSKIGTVSLDDSDEWKDLPIPPIDVNDFNHVTTIEKDERIVSMIECQGKILVATCWRVFRLESDDRLIEIIFVPHPAAK